MGKREREKKGERERDIIVSRIAVTLELCSKCAESEKYMVSERLLYLWLNQRYKAAR